MGFWGWLRKKLNRFSDLINILKGRVLALLFALFLNNWKAEIIDNSLCRIRNNPIKTYCYLLQECCTFWLFVMTPICWFNHAIVRHFEGKNKGFAYCILVKYVLTVLTDGNFIASFINLIRSIENYNANTWQSQTPSNQGTES